MGFVKEFKAFAMKGNVMDLAVGVIIGAAFGKIVTALVDDLLMPVIAMFSGGAKFNDKFFVLPGGEEKYNALAVKSLEEVRKAGINVLAYGDFIQTIVDFLIIAFCIFMVIKVMNGMKKKEEAAAAAPAGPSPTDQLLMEIRDELKKK
jgi:large conductance mechanosensitive channel